MRHLEPGQADSLYPDDNVAPFDLVAHDKSSSTGQKWAQPELHVETPDGRRVVQVHPERGDITIGRSTDQVDIDIADAYASRVHARFFRVDNRAYVADLNSKHGTTIDGERVHGETRPLRHGAEIRIGRTTIRYADYLNALTTADNAVAEKPAAHSRELDAANKSSPSFRETPTCAAEISHIEPNVLTDINTDGTTSHTHTRLSNSSGGSARPTRSPTFAKPRVSSEHPHFPSIALAPWLAALMIIAALIYAAWCVWSVHCGPIGASS